MKRKLPFYKNEGKIHLLNVSLKHLQDHYSNTFTKIDACAYRSLKETGQALLLAAEGCPEKVDKKTITDISRWIEDVWTQMSILAEHFRENTV